MKFKILFLLLLASFVVNGQDYSVVQLPYKYIEYAPKPNYVDPEVKRLIHWFAVLLEAEKQNS